MKINHHQLIGLPVVTESGQELGQLKSFNIDPDTQSILEYEIKPNSLIKGLIEGDLIIPRGQIVDISLKQITVQDNFSSTQPFKKLNKVLSKKKESIVLNKS